MTDDIRPDDRVLMLGIPETPVLHDILRTLDRGLLVAIGPDDQVRRARRECADFANAMFIPEDSSGLIPWQDRFFSLIIAPEPHSLEVQRVLSPTGRIR